MRTPPNIRRLFVVFCLTSTVPLFGQEPAQPEIRGLLARPSVLNAPFSADATTRFHHTFIDGTRVDQSTTAHYYRDAAGHVRVELLMEGLEVPKTAAERRIRTIIAPDPERELILALDPVTRTAAYLPRLGLVDATGGGRFFAVPIGGVRFLTFHPAQALLTYDALAENYAVQDESLGTRRIEEGIETIGRRLTVTIPVGYARNDVPLVIVEERWVSPELKLLISGHFSDPRVGDVEYRLMNIRRDEPSPELFVLPQDFTISSGETYSVNDPALALAPPVRYEADYAGRGGTRPLTDEQLERLRLAVQDKNRR